MPRFTWLVGRILPAVVALSLIVGSCTVSPDRAEVRSRNDRAGGDINPRPGVWMERVNVSDSTINLKEQTLWLKPLPGLPPPDFSPDLSQTQPIRLSTPND